MKQLQYIMTLLLFILFDFSCQAPVIERPDDPFRRKEATEIVLDFDYRESNSASGFVQFINLSRGFQSFFWDFGFTDAAGKPVTSTEARPYVFFPANGEYLVILEGIDVNNKRHRTRQYVLVKNR